MMVGCCWMVVGRAALAMDGSTVGGLMFSLLSANLTLVCVLRRDLLYASSVGGDMVWVVRGNYPRVYAVPMYACRCCK